MESDINRQQLEILKDIYEISNKCSTTTYIWAGLVQDVLEGRFLREHKDIDGFTLNLWDLKEEMAELYGSRGYKVSFLEDVNFMRIERNEMHAMFNRLEIDGETAMWRHIGNEGTVYFPRRWLSGMPNDFYDAKVYVSGIEFEYCIKRHPRLLSPIWNGRESDQDALKWLTSMLLKRKGDTADILRQVWSYNPYLAKKGYDQYRMPVVAWKLEPIMK